MFNHLLGRSRRQLIGSGCAAVALGAAGIWMLSRCAELPDDRCLDDGIRPDVISAEYGCVLCYCDASGELHCMQRTCAPDAGVLNDVLE